MDLCPNRNHKHKKMSTKLTIKTAAYFHLANKLYMKLYLFRQEEWYLVLKTYNRINNYRKYCVLCFSKNFLDSKNIISTNQKFVLAILLFYLYDQRVGSNLNNKLFTPPNDK